MILKIKWISWENHRRTRELANALDAQLLIKTSSLPQGFSHCHMALKTVVDLILDKPSVLFVQNPSVVLAFVATIMKFFCNYQLIVDRHSNFRLYESGKGSPLNLFWRLLSDFSLRFADLTIVTNKFLKKIVEEKKGRGFVLPDKLPKFKGMKQKILQGTFNVVFICTYANDEPYEEVIEAATLLPSSTYIYITGKIPSSLATECLPSNIILTDFLSEQDFIDLLFSADAIMDFTKRDWCLVCGGYEAISMGRPLITSGTTALMELFGEVAIYSNHEPSNIAVSINEAHNLQGDYLEKVLLFQKKFSFYWEEQFVKLQQLIFG